MLCIVKKSIVGTYVVTQNQISCQLETFCPFKPTEFYPDRFMSKDKNDKFHPYLSLPFGKGPRSCIGRRLAELSLEILLFRLSQTFHFEFAGQNEIGCTNNIINQPDTAVKLKLCAK